MKLLLLFALLPQISFACLWFDGTTLDGTTLNYNAARPPDWVLRAMEVTAEDRRETLLDRKLDASNPDSEKAREAVVAILSGKNSDAIEILEQIETSSPGKYETATNLGTAYELAGDNKNALKWITEGVRRNPESHHGTEWLHQRILEAKILLEENPEYLKTHRVIPLPEAFTGDTMVEVSGTARSASEIWYAASSQLAERVVFVKPPDPVVADLLFTLGRIEARLNVVETARPLLEAAQEYGFADPGLLLRIKAKYQEVADAGNIHRQWMKLFWRVVTVLGIGLFLIGVSIAIRKRGQSVRKL